MGHIIDATGVRANPKKIQAILDMKPPKNLTEVQIHNGKLATLSQFLSQASEKQLPFFKVLIKCNKNKVFKWTNEAQAAFQDLKIFLTELLTLTALNPSKTRTPYLAASQEAIGSVLLVERNKVQKPIYFFSKLLQDAQANYPPLE
ncbi:reverse transcriptase domain-containing protein [Tanacetum coccineum]